jgi:hypothetical protein
MAAVELPKRLGVAPGAEGDVLVRTQESLLGGIACDSRIASIVASALGY